MESIALKKTHQNFLKKKKHKCYIRIPNVELLLIERTELAQKCSWEQKVII